MGREDKRECETESEGERGKDRGERKMERKRWKEIERWRQGGRAIGERG